MPRGITENDVWGACDALLLEGARPTIERVRQRIGSGSPNTVSPYLDTWFKHLGGRIKDPGAFSAPPALPEPVQQAAQHFWEVALAQTRLDFDERLKEGMAAAVANVEAEKARAAEAEAAAFGALARANRLQADLADASAALEHEKLAHAAKSANLDDARRQITDLTQRVERLDTAITQAREHAGTEIAAAVERAAGAERRAALEIDSERTLRAKAEKRVDSLERRIESSQAELLAERSAHVESTTRMQGELARSRQEATQVLAQHASLTRRVEDMAEMLAQAQRQAEVAEARASLSESLLARLAPTVAAPKTKNRVSRKSQGTPA